MDIIKIVEKEVKEKILDYKINSHDNYDYWEEHIKFVYDEGKKLAIKYNANIEIVSLGTLLHDIALICKVGDRKEHHKNGKLLAEEILSKYNYPKEKKEQVLMCIYNHRSAKNATSIEEQCVADADILAHFDNIPMLFNSAFNKNKLTLSETKEWMAKYFEKDFQDLSDQTKNSFKDKYNLICEIVLGKK